MDRSKLKDTYEFIGFAAIVASLIFVGFELRQNTLATESASIDNLSNLTHEFYMSLASDEDLHRIWQEGTSQGTPNPDLDEDLNRFIWLERSRALRMQTAYLQWQRGTLGDRDFDFYRPFICGLDQVHVWSSGIRRDYLPEFIAFVESC